MNNTIVIILFISFIIIAFYDNFICKYKNIENMSTGSSTYQDPNLSNDPLYLAKLNASNISYLKSQIDEISDIKTTVDSLNEQVESNSSAIQSINTSIENTGTDSIPDQDTLNNLASTADS